MRIDITQEGEQQVISQTKISAKEIKVSPIKAINPETPHQSNNQLKEMLLNGSQNQEQKNSGVIINGNHLTVFCIDSSNSINNISEKTLLSSDLTSIVFLYLLEKMAEINDNITPQKAGRIAYLNYLKTVSQNSGAETHKLEISDTDSQLEMDLLGVN
jgi:hypothetical protein